MSPTQPTSRPGGRSERVRSAVHQAVIDLLSDPHVVEPTIPVIAQRAGVNHTSIYRRWGSREALLADVAITRLEEEWPLPDTGTLRGDLTEWVAAGVASVFKPEGRLIVRALALSLPGSSEAQAERAQHFERRAGAIQRIRERATARGENPPPLDQILDQLIGPLYVRAIFGSAPPPPGYPELLVERLFAGMSTSACLDTHGAH
ncbi:TetR/AcrR family transcriptional regulator [Streptomyces sp. NBC_01750]|uniref:TetR/AcrR family transcriptional regulator n=1 Tax=Streptomyces sp. NBC_01750 TaxID=2975928 RepID=UPI002DDB7AD4|nr:TetR/AcrR family transcriptional regulator [Streptomyces sp. NBC_01750]WSD32778.1 TetR/AcrR family transcriptional regulator [Streptomyces sp. NBC_01750]